MNILISHDIDHLAVKDHVFKDLIIPKYLFWSFSELVRVKISLRTFFRKIVGLFKKNAWNNLKELLDFDQQNGIKSTVFIAVNKGKGIIYSQERAKKAVDLVKSYNFDVGVHGICYDDYKGIEKEYQDFKKISGLDRFGIRMHYLRKNNDTLNNLAKAGYWFDTTVLSEEIKQEYKIGEMFEVPLHIMESDYLGADVGYNLEEVKQKTIELLNKAESQNKRYFSVLFHQRNFSSEFPLAKEWYLWFISYCRSKNYQFISYKDLLCE